MPPASRGDARAGRRPRGSARLLLGLLAAALAAAPLAGCGAREDFRDGQAVGWLASARFDAAPGTGTRYVRLRGGGEAAGWPWLPHLRFERRTDESKLSPLLRDWLAARPGDERLEVLVGYADPLAMPAFPVESGPPASDATRDSLALTRCDAIADSLVAVRAPWYGAERARLAADHGATMVDSFWIARAVVARLRARDVLPLARRRDVVSVQFAHRGAPAPDYCDGLGELETRDAVTGDGRALLNSDPLRDAGYGTGRLGLLDTGVWTEHRLLAGPAASTATLGPALQALDCVGAADCSGGDPMDTDAAQGGHGTVTCGILVGDRSMGDCLEGATRARVVSHRIYTPDPAIPEGAPSKGVVDPTAYMHACERLLRKRPPIAIVEVAESQGPYGTLSSTAARLYRAGLVVIAAAGNGYSEESPDKSWVGSPGDHPWVLSVGARSTREPERTTDSQSRGLVGFRGKPDLQAPSETSSAGVLEGDEEHLKNLTGTSGATPYAGAAALLLRNRLRATADGPAGADPDPGQVYAILIACADGRRGSGPAHPPEFPLATGAGLLELPSAGMAWWGKLMVGTSARVDVPLDGLPAAAGRLRVALWWPDPLPASLPWAGGTAIPHADFDLHLVGPDGKVRASSKGIGGVFERLDVSGPAASPAGWTLRVQGVRVGPGKRPVYLAAVATW